MSNGQSINADAATASVLVAVATHAVNTTTIGIAAKKLFDKIKKKKQKETKEESELGL